MLGGGFWGFMVALLISGALAAIEIVRKKNPQAAAAVEKAAQFSGWIGLFLLIFSVINLLDVLRVFSMLLQIVPVSTIVILAALVVGLILGVLQVLSLAKQFNLLTAEKAASIEGKIIPIKIPVGIVAMISSVYLMLWNIIGWGF